MSRAWAKNAIITAMEYMTGDPYFREKLEEQRISNRELGSMLLRQARATDARRDEAEGSARAAEARAAELEEALLEIDKWQTGENNIEDDEDWEADEVLRRRVRAIVKQALAGRKG